MGVNVFISYSHRDEALKESLEEHLSGLRRNGTIDAWNDRMIVAGQDWKDEISENLESSELILFLISSSFLNSDYCVNVEAKRALEMHNEGKAQLIPIVVRAVKWNDSELAKVQGLPKDAKPVKSWNDEDEAWVNVVEGIQDHIDTFQPKKEIVPQETILDKVCISDATSDWLEDTEITLTHRKVDKIRLSDIYVTPDLEFDGDSKPEVGKYRSSNSILSKPDRYIVSGEEQQGKTSLLKNLYMGLLKQSHLPIYLDASQIKKSDIQAVIKKSLDEQYECLDIEGYLANPKRVILIDNIDEIGLRPKFRNIFLDSINEAFEYCIVSCHNSFAYVYNEIPAIDCYSKSELLGFGNKKREEIVQRWLSLGSEESIDEAELYSQCDEIKERLNNVIKKNIVPPKPIYVLMLLQMFEANSQLNLELTSYGHCYQGLIYQAFDNAKISKLDVDKYLNVLTELAWWIFIHEVEPNQHQLDKFFQDYCDKYLPVDQSSVIKKLTEHSILSERDYKVSFKYPYIYYFFVGKKIAETYSDSEEVKEQVQNLLSKLHREDFANILIFITHHTKDSWVLNEIKVVLASLFDEHNVATLEKKQLAFMDEFMQKIPELILEQREIQSERDAHNERLDDFERNNQEEVSEEPADILANINKTFKGMEIAGQIIRNRHATLTRDSLLDLATSGVSTGLRFLEYFITISDTAMNEIVKVISNHLSEQPDLSDREIEKHAEHAYLHLTYGVVNAVIRKISSAVGSKEALEIYTLLEKKSGTPAASLIKQAIELQFNKTLKISSVESCVEKLHDNPVCMRILKELIVQHIYMFPVEYKEKQKLSNLLGITVKGQRLMDQRKVGKG